MAVESKKRAPAQGPSREEELAAQVLALESRKLELESQIASLKSRLGAAYRDAQSGLDVAMVLMTHLEQLARGGVPDHDEARD